MNSKDNVPRLWSLICEKVSTSNGLQRYEVCACYLLLLSWITLSMTKRLTWNFKRLIPRAIVVRSHSRTLRSSRRIAIAYLEMTASMTDANGRIMRNCEITPTCENITRHHAVMCANNTFYWGLLIHRYTYAHAYKYTACA